MTNEEHLNWADVEAWAKSNPRTTRNSRGGYNTVCPVRTHRSPSQRLAIRDDGDGGIDLWCYSRCTRQKVLAAIAKAINKPSAPPVTEPQSDQVTPPPPVETPPAAGPLTAAAIEAHWPTIFQAVEPGTQWHKVTTLLRDARVAAVQDDVVILQFDYPFHAEQVDKPENRLLTEKALQRELGRPLRVRAVVKGATVAARIKELEGELTDRATRIRKLEAEKSKLAGAAREAREEAERHAQSEIAKLREEVKEKERERAAAEAEKDSLDEQLEKLDSRYRRLRGENKSIKGKLSRRDKKIEGLGNELTAAADKVRKLEKEYPDLLKAAGAERDKERAARKKLEEELPVSKSEAIKDAWELLDQNPTVALKEAVSILESKLRQALKDDLMQNQRIDRPILLDKALEKRYISEKQRFHLGLINQMRNKGEHGENPIPSTRPQVRAALVYLEQVIDKLRPAKAGSQDLQRLAARWNDGG